MATAMRSGTVPRIRPQDISWRLRPGYLLVQVDLYNPTSERTEDATLVIEAAPFGAFVPFEPGSRIPVTGLSPGEKRRVTAMIPASQLPVSGPVRSGLPERPLTHGDLILRYRTLLEVERVRLTARSAGHSWGGNLNVYLDTAPQEAVEVHRAMDLKVEAGQTVHFVFLLDPREEYTITARVSDPAWAVDVRPAQAPGMAEMLVTTPGEIGARGGAEVLVARTSDGKTVPVEFGFQTVEGEGETLGCVDA